MTMTENQEGSVSDGHHTFDELYEFRRVYNTLLFNEWSSKGLYDVHKSIKHSDGTYCFGEKGKWFIVVAETPYGQISNHYKMEHFDTFICEERELPNTFDNHTSGAVALRLNLTIKLQCAQETSKTMTFGQAIEKLREGNLIQRLGWNGKNMWVFKQVPSRCDISIVPRMTSLPKAVKDKLVDQDMSPTYRHQLAIIQPTGMVDSWVPSVSDLFIEDWVTYSETTDTPDPVEGIIHKGGIESFEKNVNENTKTC